MIKKIIIKILVGKGYQIRYKMKMIELTGPYTVTEFWDGAHTIKCRYMFNPNQFKDAYNKFIN